MFTPWSTRLRPLCPRHLPGKMRTPFAPPPKCDSKIYSIYPEPTFMSIRGFGLMAFTPCPTVNAAWLTNTEASSGLIAQVMAADSPTGTTPSGGDMVKGGGTVH